MYRFVRFSYFAFMSIYDDHHDHSIQQLTLRAKLAKVHVLRTQVGHALREIGSPEARAVLDELIDDADELSVFLGVKALFDADPATAFDRTAKYFTDESLATPTGATIACEILSTFAPGSFTSKGPDWTESRAPTWLREDRRWLELCVRSRKHDVLGGVAREVLRYVEKEFLEAARRCPRRRGARRN